MKKHFTSLSLLILIQLFFFGSLVGYSQTLQEPCATAIKHKRLMDTDPRYALRFNANEQALQNKILNNGSGNHTQTVTYTIPMVVHVIHLGEAVGTGTNISDAQIHSAIDALNDAYRKKPGSVFDGSGVDMNIEFCLVSKDTLGNPFSGIERINGTGVGNYQNVGVDDNTNNEAQIKALSFWNNTKYYNVWVVSEINDNNGGPGTQGYAYFPPGGPFNLDGTIVLYNAFGFDPNGTLGYNLKSYTNLNGTMTHEMGHALNLYHTFEDDGTGSTCPPNTSGQCATEGDKVCDTPPHMRSVSTCVADGTANSCASGTTAIDYQHNYMDYSSEACKNMFTAGQSSRATTALTTLRAQLIDSTNLISCGCSSTAVQIALTTGTNPMCAGQSSVTFTATPSHAGATPTYQWYLNGVVVNGETGVTFSSSSITNDTVICIMTPSINGALPVTSNQIIMSSTTSVTPTIAAAITTGSTTACSGDSLVFTATPTNGGTVPVYHWLINGIDAGVDSTVFSTTLSTGTAVITCQLVSDAPCATTTTVTSTPITVTVTSAPVINFVADKNICGGAIATTTFSTTPSGATVNWTNSNTSIGLAASGAGNLPAFTAVNSTDSIITSTVVVTPSLNNGCLGIPSAFIIAVDPTPTILQNGSTLMASTSTSYQWYFNNQPVVGDTTQSITPDQPGNYSVIVAGSSCPSNVVNLVNAGIQELDGESIVVIYPNPNEGDFTLSFNSVVKSTYHIKLTNALGELIYTEVLSDFIGNYSHQLDLSAYSKGIYLISISSNTSAFNRKVLIY